MILGQFRDLIRAEAKIKGSDEMDVWLNETIQDELNTLTAQMRYPELRSIAALTIADGAATIPPTAQHLNLDNVIYRPLADAANDYPLIRNKHTIGQDLGLTKYVYRVGTTLIVWPTIEMDGSDILLLEYWRYPTLATDQAVIPVDGLIPTLKLRAVTRAILHTDSKLAKIHHDLGQESHAMSFGATDVNDQ